MEDRKTYSFIDLVTGFFAKFSTLLLRILAMRQLLARLIGIDYSNKI